MYYNIIDTLCSIACRKLHGNGKMKIWCQVSWAKKKKLFWNIQMVQWSHKTPFSGEEGSRRVRWEWCGIDSKVFAATDDHRDLKPRNWGILQKLQQVRKWVFTGAAGIHIGAFISAQWNAALTWHSELQYFKF